MRHVTFGKPVPPYCVGDKRLMPDALAKKLETDGLLSASEPWPATAAAPATKKPRRPTPTIERPAGLFDDRIAR